ncbi:MAG: hypothetical protein IJJ85_00830 [Clostridia bacterium]|nr:hypothetical protein [Clostridia bacterium]
MLFQFREKLTEVSLPEVSADTLTVGYVTGEELSQVADCFGFDESTVESCRQASRYFRSGVEIHDSYTFTELRIAAVSENDLREDCVALYFRRNLVLVVDVEDFDGSTKSKFFAALRRFSASKVNTEKVIGAFLDNLVGSDIKYIEDTGIAVAELEKDVLSDSEGKEFTEELLTMKRSLLKQHNFYEQLLDITEALEENDNDILDEDRLIYITNVTNKIRRLKEDIDTLSSAVVHLQDAYSAHLDLKLNNSMKIFTVITTVFFPLTIIVGWYGMNFDSMPEFHWKYGYLFVIALSAVLVGGLLLLAKKKKWF